MRIGTNFEQTKLKALINDGGDVTLIIDHHLDNEKLKSLNKKNRQILSKFNFHGTPTLKRGILILTKKSSGIKISNITHHNNNDILAFEITLPDKTKIDCTAVYAPSKDIPSFWNDVYTIHNQSHNTHKIIIGDFNCTLDPKADTMGYKTDPHQKIKDNNQQLAT